MKSILLSLACCILTTYLYAQPVITSDAAPQEGDNYVSYTADTVNFGPGEAGANMIWDFSNVNTDSVIGFPFEYLDPAGVPFSESFPEANLALVISAAVSFGNSFYIVGNDQIELIGNSLSNISVTTYSDPRVQIVFPLTYQSSFVDSFASSTNIMGLVSTLEGIDSVFIDGYGTLILPDRVNSRSVETFENVLRVRLITNQTNTTSIGGSNSETVMRNVSHIWLSPDYTTSLATHQLTTGETRTFLMPGNPVIDPLPEVSTFSWTEQEGTSPFYSVTPEDQLNVSWRSSQPVLGKIRLLISSPQTDLLKWGIFDIGGKLVTSGKMPLAKKNTDLIIHPSFTTGSYFIRLETDSGLHRTIKFIKL